MFAVGDLIASLYDVNAYKNSAKNPYNTYLYRIEIKDNNSGLYHITEIVLYQPYTDKIEKYPIERQILHRGISLLPQDWCKVYQKPKRKLPEWW